MQQGSGQNVDFQTRLSDSFVRHRWTFMLSVAIVIVVTVISLRLRKPAYRAFAQTQVVSENQDLQAALGQQENQFTWTNPAQKNVNHLTDLLTDDRPDGFIDTALKAADLKRPISVDPRAADPRFGLLRKRLSVNSDSDNLFSVALTWEDREECERIVTALQTQYIEEVSATSTRAATETTKFLETSMAEYEKRMRTAEASLIAYKQAHLGAMPDQQNADLMQLATLKNQRDAIIIASQDSALKQAALEARLKEVNPQSIANQVVADGPSMLALRGLENKRAVLLSDGFLSSSKEVQDADAEIAALTRQVNIERKSSPNGGDITVQTSMQANPEYQDLEQQLTAAKIASATQASQLKNLNEQIAAHEASVAAMPAAERELNDKTRDYAILKARYESLVARHEDAKEKARLERLTAKSTLIPVGTVFAQPTTTKSKTALMAAGAILVGVLIGVALVIFNEWTDPTLRYGADVERILDVPLLCETPEIRSLPRSDAYYTRGAR